MLRHALERASRGAVARFASHDRERLGLLRVRGDVIALHGLWWLDEIRAPATVVPRPHRPRVHQPLHRGAARGDRGQAGRSPAAGGPGASGPAGSAGGPDGRAAGVGRQGPGGAAPQEAPATPAKKAVARKTVRKALTQALSSQNAGRADDQRGRPAR
ncbi:Ku protein [Streptomyces sp. NPDC004129]|uniref:Ku protein n=1 Tax=Streptomyces sp. NPDC004533 TaxID=3154278 RepID=UPI00339FE47E